MTQCDKNDKNALSGQGGCLLLQYLIQSWEGGREGLTENEGSLKTSKQIKKNLHPPPTQTAL
jgi:hypothetical protein